MKPTHSHEIVVLSCRGADCGDLLIPSFELRRGEILGLSIPAPFGEVWDAVMGILNGASSTSDVVLNGSAVSIMPPLNRFTPDCTLANLVATQQIPRDRAASFAIEHGIRIDERIAALPATLKMLIEVLRARRAAVDMIAFSTAGLDPLGIKAVHRAVEQELGTVAGLHVFATSLESEVRRLTTLDKVVRCS